MLQNDDITLKDDKKDDKIVLFLDEFCPYGRYARMVFTLKFDYSIIVDKSQ